MTWLAAGALAVTGVLTDVPRSLLAGSDGTTATTHAAAQSDDPDVARARAEEERLRVLLDEALADTAVERDELLDIQARLDAARNELRIAEGQLALAEEALVAAEGRRAAAEANLEIATRLLAETEAELADEEHAFANHVVVTYKYGAAGRGQMIASIVNTASTPNDFVTGLYRLGAVIDHQDAIVDRLADLREEQDALQQEAEQERLTAEEEKQLAVETFEFVTELKIQATDLRDRVAQEEAVQKGILSQVSEEANDLSRRYEAAKRATRKAEEEARRRALAARDGVLCPIDPVWFSNDWGYPRSGGRRHKGNDLFADEGTPIVAISDGIVRKLDRTDTYVPGSNRGDLGGISISYYVDDAEYWYWAHLQRLAPGLEEGGFIEAGQVIGWVGKTGNAYNTPPHAHVGRYVNGSAVNPYETLKAACG